MKPPVFDARAAKSYAEGPPRQVPGYSSLHRMVSLLLAERTPQDGRVLVLGAGGGQELKALAEAHSGWSVDGVDRSSDILRVAVEERRPTLHAYASTEATSMMLPPDLSMLPHPFWFSISSLVTSVQKA
jgi:SAM-dependent methyltransferase